MMTMKTRFGGNAPGLPGLPPLAPLPSLVGALSRRRAIFGPVEREGGASCATTQADLDLAAARALHARRELEAALDHGTALLAALGLPRIVDVGFVQVDAGDLGDALDVVLAHLDAIDPDPDLEPSLGAPENHSATTVRVGDWQWQSLPPDQRRWAQGADDGREADVVDEPHDEDTDAELTAIESHGKGFRRSGHDDAEDNDPAGGQQRDEDLLFWSFDVGCTIAETAHV